MHNEHDKENRAIMMTVKNKLPNKEERTSKRYIYIYRQQECEGKETLDRRRKGEIGERESSVHLRVKWTVDKINRDGKEISSRRTRARRKKSRATAEKGNFE